MEPIVETSRLIIRPLLPEDEEGMFSLDSDPVVHEFIGKKPVKTLEESRAVIAFIRQQYEELGIGRWAVLEKNTNDFVGWLGFKFMKGPVNAHTDFYDFGYRLRQMHWGKGYATEASLACLDYGLQTLGFKNIHAMTDVDNAASRRVLEKVGFSLVEIFNYDAELSWRKPNQPTTWYEYKQKWI